MLEQNTDNDETINLVKQSQNIENFVDLFKRKLRRLAYFLTKFKSSEIEKDIAHFLATLDDTVKTYTSLLPNQIECKDKFKFIEVLMEFTGQNRIPVQCKTASLGTVKRIFDLMAPEEIAKIHPSFVRKLQSCRGLYHAKVEGRVIMTFLQMLYLYVCKFPSESHVATIGELNQALVTGDENLLTALTKWKSQNIQGDSLRFANAMTGGKFYLLAVRYAATATCYFQPYMASIIYAEWNNVALNCSFDVRREAKPGSITVEYSDIEKYEFITNNGDPRLEMNLADDATMKLYVVDAEDLLELKQFLTPILGSREKNALKCLDTCIKHIRFVDSSILIDHHSLLEASQEFSNVTANDNELALQQSAINSSVVHNTTDRIAPANARYHCAASPPPSVCTEVETVEEYSRHNGIIGLSKLAQEQGAGNRNAKRTLSDPYDISNIRDEDRAVGSSVGNKKKGQGLGISKKRAPPAPKKAVNKANQADQSLEQTGGLNTKQSMNNRSTEQHTQRIATSEEEDLLTDVRSDDLWQPNATKRGRMKKSTTNRANGVGPPITAVKLSSEKVTTIKRGNKRRESVMSVQEISFQPNQSKTSFAPPGQAMNDNSFDSLEMYEMLEKIQKNRMLDSDSSSSISMFRKRKSPSEAVPDGPQAFVRIAASNVDAGACERPVAPDASSIRVAHRESPVGENDLIPVIASRISFCDTSDGNWSCDSKPTKLEYVLSRIAGPAVDELGETLKTKVAQTKQYTGQCLKARDARLEAILQKQRLYKQQQQTAIRTYNELLQMALDYKRARPSNTELDHTIREIGEAEQMFNNKLEGERDRIESTVSEAVAHDWEYVKKSYTQALQDTINLTNN